MVEELGSVLQVFKGIDEDIMLGMLLVCVR